MTTAQVLFSIALGVMSLIIVAFAFFVVFTTKWGNRWVKEKPVAVETARATEED